ncbi:MAG TPA: hypothetical protein PLF44_07155 [Candidatus Mcinerneyibacteriales bacterium]|nr:hypothetical protein [Candidatus Mcinerneyibacteriales bacterium]
MIKPFLKRLSIFFVFLFSLISLTPGRPLNGKLSFSLLTYGPSLSAELEIKRFYVEAGGFAGLIDEGWFFQGGYGLMPGRLQTGVAVKMLTTHDSLFTLGLAEEESRYTALGPVLEVRIFRLFFLSPFLKGELLTYFPQKRGQDTFTAFNVQLGVRF